MAISYSVRFWLLLMPLMPYIIVSIFNLYHLLRSRALRTALNNHVIILLLFYGLFEELIDVVSLIHFYRIGTALSLTREFCFVWSFIGTLSIASIYLLMAWASIERHILIFHSNWFATRKKLLFFHYLPLAICILWPMIFYLIPYFIIPCNLPIDYNIVMCSLPWCIVLILLLRVLYHRYRIRQRIEWRNYKKMAAQLLPISTLYLLLAFPLMILYVAYAAGLPTDFAADYFSDSVFFFYWIILFTPFASVMSLPELQLKCKKIFLFWQRNRVVRPEILTMTRMRAGYTTAIIPSVVH